MAKPRMCPHCRAFIDSSDKTCPYCENDLPMTAGRRLLREERIRNAGAQVSFTTTILLLINAGLFVVSWVLTTRFTGEMNFMGGIDGNVLLMLGGKYRLSILVHGEWWRLVTANFLHGGLMHIAFNSMSLFNLGTVAEEVFGTTRYISLYLVTGICGFVASMMWSNSLSIGASASICGLIGAMYAYGRISFNSHLQSVGKRWILFIAIFGFLFPAIDNAAHFGGLVSGFGFAYICGTPGQDRDKETMWQGVAIAAVAATVIAFYFAYSNFALATG